MYRVTVTDTRTGDSQTREVRPGDYLVLAFPPCMAHFAGETLGGRQHRLIITDRVPGPAPSLWRPES